MKKNTAENRVRQARRCKRKAHQRAKRLAARRPISPQPPHPVSYDDFRRMAKRHARPGDRLRTVYASGEIAKALGIDAQGDELYPVAAVLIRPDPKP